ncbi:MAG: LysM peptidoglycan-binding domain-containing protein [Methylacidiphilales bacterium]|nr:LysM peptidoglycan-binding domain-containing protein [Candidatus Methylacidiphilales bacterium]
MSRSISLFLVATLALAGCNPIKPQDSQYDDPRNPHYQQAQQDLDNNNPAAAAAEYEAAIEANPKLVNAQYQLGVLYGEKLQDPVSSIYHFKQFLVLAPNSDHAANARDMIDKEGKVFAASQPNSSAQNADELAKLQADNAALKKQADDAAHTIAQLQEQLAEAGKFHQSSAPSPAANPPAAAPVAADDTNAPPLAQTPDANQAAPSTNAAPAGPLRALPLDATNANATAAAPGADAGPSRTYQVVKGDSLWKIAHKMYPGDTKNGVDKIEEANKDAIGNKPLKIGQVLIIPQ